MRVEVESIFEPLGLAGCFFSWYRTLAKYYDFNYFQHPVRLKTGKQGSRRLCFRQETMTKKARDHAKLSSKSTVEPTMEMETSCIPDMMEDNGQEAKISRKVNNLSQVTEPGGTAATNSDRAAEVCRQTGGVDPSPIPRVAREVKRRRKPGKRKNRR